MSSTLSFCKGMSNNYAEILFIVSRKKFNSKPDKAFKWEKVLYVVITDGGGVFIII